MHPVTLAAAAALIPSVFAFNYGGSGDSASKTMAASPATSSGSDGAVHVVNVGRNGRLSFEPNQVKAAVGDRVEFHFFPDFHSVAQSSFDKPCEPLNDTAFFSGPVDIQSGMSDMVWTLDIRDEDPKWFYCATANHCQSGMVGVINPASSGRQTIQRFASAASDAGNGVAPSSTGGGTFASATSSAASSDEPTQTSSNDEPGAGAEARGDVRWGLMGSAMALAVFTGAMML